MEQFTLFVSIVAKKGRRKRGDKFVENNERGNKENKPKMNEGEMQKDEN